MKGIQVAKPSSTISIGAFANVVWYGDQVLQMRPEMDSIKKTEGHKEELVGNKKNTF